LDNVGDEEFSCFNEAHSFRKHRSGRDSFRSAGGICSVLVVGLFILTFLAQNYVIPSGSMENTLIVGDHLVVDQITLVSSTPWTPLIAGAVLA
jgi:hypothetical protein